MTNDAECRECRAGRTQAVNCDIAWFCPDHGTQRLDIGAMLAALAQTRADLAAAQAREVRLREALGRLIHCADERMWPGVNTMAQARAALAGEAGE